MTTPWEAMARTEAGERGVVDDDGFTWYPNNPIEGRPRLTRWSRVRSWWNGWLWRGGSLWVPWRQWRLGTVIDNRFPERHG
jgi:hypothetical protein